MSTKYPGGLIRKTPPTITAPNSFGEGGSAPGIWTLEQASYYTKQRTWPQPTYTKELWAWGSNTYGEIGQNDITDRSSPTQVGALTSWVDISNSAQHIVAVKTDGTLWSWGLNSSGQLGQNDVVNRSSPVQVGALTNWYKIGSSTNSSYAIKTNGTLWAWGANASGQLGLNDVIVYSSPVQVGALTNWTDVSKSSTGSFCFAINSNNQLFGFGSNSSGQLGQNDQVDRSSPTQVGALTNWITSVTGVGNSSFLSIKTDGTLWSWGLNSSGQLGQNDVVTRSSPVQVGALTNWNYIACGGTHSLSTQTDGKLWSWGSNQNGQLGQNDRVARSSPTQVGALTDWLYVFGSDASFSIKTNKTLWSWGANSTGILGQNNATNRSSPVQVGARTVWNQVSAGGYFTAALTKYT